MIRGLRGVLREIYSAQGVRKVTTGITGLWQPSVLSSDTILVLTINHVNSRLDVVTCMSVSTFL